MTVFAFGIRKIFEADIRVGKILIRTNTSERPIHHTLKMLKHIISKANYITEGYIRSPSSKNDREGLSYLV
ncbi:hypothetical protein J23TS9_15020 [Paenibacillus sp. J23TS9]|nr:hypothetical protein J23TS9_15020 [Paenibacillus sp. J23TS9]